MCILTCHCTETVNGYVMCVLANACAADVALEDHHVGLVTRIQNGPIQIHAVNKSCFIIVDERYRRTEEGIREVSSEYY
jgi:hypothetical protein